MSDQLVEVLEEAKSRGFLGPGSVVDHIDHSRQFRRGFPVGATKALDLGSGGGVPGLVLAAEDDLVWTLLDSMDKRCDFLDKAVETLQLGDRVSVVYGRAEEWARNGEFREQFDVVVARSFGPPAVVAECATGFLQEGGVLLVSEPPASNDRWSAEGLRDLGLETAETYSDPMVASFKKSGPLSDRYPRRNGIPDKRPRW